VGYLMIDGEDLDHLYVDPRHQGRGAGGTLLAKAKELSRERIVLRTFQQNAMARSFYEKRGFIVGETTDGRNEENEPDVQYVWTSQPYTEHRTEAESPVQ
jgi:GNAT superfamily N-acetyltransferase